MNVQFLVEAGKSLGEHVFCGVGMHLPSHKRRIASQGMILPKFILVSTTHSAIAEVRRGDGLSRVGLRVAPKRRDPKLTAANPGREDEMRTYRSAMTGP
jgi:hypothetical protein